MIISYKSIAPYTTIKYIYRKQDDKVYSNKYAEISDKYLKTFLAAYVCYELVYNKNIEKFIAEFMRHMLNKCVLVKRQTAEVKKISRQYSLSKVRKYIDESCIPNIDEYFAIGIYRVDKGGVLS